MSELTLRWREGSQIYDRTIKENEPSKNPGTIRIGRNPQRCDVVLTNTTVSGLHVEIFFDSRKNSFCLRNLRDTNPPTVDGQKIIQGEVSLKQGSTIYLGHILLTVVAVSLSSNQSNFPTTVILPPKPQPQQSQPSIPQGIYSLECPRCHRISPYEQIDFGCQWCGTSLAGAASVFIPKKK